MNYVTVLTSGPFWSQLANSTITALGTTLGVVALGVLAAFVIARYECPGSGRPVRGVHRRVAVPDHGRSASAVSAAEEPRPGWGACSGLIILQVAVQLPVTIIILVLLPARDPRRARGCGGHRRARAGFGFFWRILLPLSWPGARGSCRGAGVRRELVNAYLLPLADVLGFYRRRTPAARGAVLLDRVLPGHRRRYSPSPRW